MTAQIKVKTSEIIIPDDDRLIQTTVCSYFKSTGSRKLTRPIKKLHVKSCIKQEQQYPRFRKIKRMKRSLSNQWKRSPETISRDDVICEITGTPANFEQFMMTYQNRVIERMPLAVEIFSEDEENSPKRQKGKFSVGDKTPKQVVAMFLNKPTVKHSPVKPKREPLWKPTESQVPVKSEVLPGTSRLLDTSISQICNDITQPTYSKGSCYEKPVISIDSDSNDDTNVERIPSTPKKSKILSNSNGRSQNRVISGSTEENSILKGSDIRKSPSTSSGSKIIENKEFKEPNFFQLNSFMEFIGHICTSSHLRCLLSQSDLKIMRKFVNSSKEINYICIKLFMRQRIWYGITKLCESIDLKLNLKEIMKMYQELKDESFVLTDISQVELSTLLNILNKKQLVQIGREMRLKSVNVKKGNLIAKLIESCNTQSTLTKVKSIEQILRNLIQKEMGLSIKLNPELDDCIFRVYLLNTFANSQFNNPKDYFRTIGMDRAQFPTYRVEKFTIFDTADEFLHFTDAVRCRNALDECLTEGNKLPYMFEICQNAFDCLKNIMTTQGNNRTQRLPYHEKFTASHCFAEVLTSGSNQLASKYSGVVKTWLGYLLTLQICPHRRASWVNTLALIEGHYLKQPNAAIEVICDALNQPHNFCDLQILELIQRAEVYSKKRTITQLNRDKLARLTPSNFERNWPSVIIDRKQIMRGNIRNSGKYVEVDEFGEKIFLGVEQVALRHYLTNEFTKGDHYENWILSTLFCLLFWDIIYDSYVEGVFVSKIQTIPLDMNSEQFYLNRKSAIDKRLNDIEYRWLDEKLHEKIISTFNEHSHENGLSRLDVFKFTPAILIEIVDCIGRRVLAKILKRLVVNYRFYRSGFPDLFVWNPETKKCKFVEVKSENDVLSLKQKLWLNYLQDNGANIELCHVHSIGMKKKVRCRTSNTSQVV